MLGDGGLQPGQAFAGGVPAGRFLVAQGIQLFTQLGDQAIHAGLLAAEQPGGAVAEFAVVFVQGATNLADQRGHGALLFAEAGLPVLGGLFGAGLELSGDGGKLLLAVFGYGLLAAL